MGDQPAQHGVGLLGVAQVPGAVQRVQARGDKAGRVTDVMQPRGGRQEISVRTESLCQAACPRGHALYVRPPPGKGLLEE